METDLCSYQPNKETDLFPCGVNMVEYAFLCHTTYDQVDKNIRCELIQI